MLLSLCGIKLLPETIIWRFPNLDINLSKQFGQFALASPRIPASFPSVHTSGVIHLDMGVIRGLLTGLTLAGIITVAYEQRLYSTSSYLRNALANLTKDLDSLRIQSRYDEVPLQPVRVDQLPLSEQVKVQVSHRPFRTSCDDSQPA